MCMYRLSAWCPQSSQGTFRCAGTESEVVVSYHVGAESHTQVIYKSSKYSERLSNLSSP